MFTFYIQPCYNRDLVFVFHLRGNLLLPSYRYGTVTASIVVCVLNCFNVALKPLVKCHVFAAPNVSTTACADASAFCADNSSSQAKATVVAQQATMEGVGSFIGVEALGDPPEVASAQQSLSDLATALPSLYYRQGCNSVLGLAHKKSEFKFKLALKPLWKFVFAPRGRY